MNAEPALCFSLRPARIADVPALHGLIIYWAERGKVLPKTQAYIADHVDEFLVAELHGAFAGAGGLHVDSLEMAEVRSVVVIPEYQGRGLGTMLVNALIERARERGVARVYCLTNLTSWYASMGFEVIDKKTAPDRVAGDCHRCDVVMAKRLRESS